MPKYTQNIQARAASAGQRQSHALYSSRAPYVAEQFVGNKYSPPTANELGGAPTMGQLYQTSMGKLDELSTNVMDRLKGYGNAQMQRLAQSFKSAMGEGMANLASTGLSGTTMAPSMRMGFAREYSLALNDLGDRLAGQQAQTQMALGMNQEQQRAQLGTAANQQAYNYDVLQQREDAATTQANLGLGGIQSRNAANVQSFMLGGAALAQRGNEAAMRYGGGGGGYGDYLGGGYGGYTPPRADPPMPQSIPNRLPSGMSLYA